MLLSETIKYLEKNIASCDAAIAGLIEDAEERGTVQLLDNWRKNRQHFQEMLDSVKAAQKELRKIDSDMPHGGPGRQDWPPPSNKR